MQELDRTLRQRQCAALASWLAAQQWSAWIVPYVLIYGAAALITVQRLRVAPER